MGAYDFLNDITNDTLQQLNSQNQSGSLINKAQTIETMKSEENYFGTSAKEAVNALSFGVTSNFFDNYDYDIMGNEDQTVTGQLFGGALSLVTGGILAKGAGEGMQLLSKLGGSLIPKSILPELTSSIDNIVSQITAHSQIYKNGEKLINPLLKFGLPVGSNLALIAGSTAVTPTHYIDQDGNFKSEHVNLFSSEGYKAMLMNIVPTGIFEAGFFIGAKKLGPKPDIAKTAQIAKNNYVSEMNIEPGDVDGVFNKLNEVGGTSYSTNNEKFDNIDSNNISEKENQIHSKTYDVTDNEGNEIKEANLIKDDEQVEHITSKIDSVTENYNKKDATEQEKARSFDSIKSMLNKASLSFKNKSEEEKNNIVKQIVENKNSKEVVESLKNEDSKYKVKATNYYHSSKKFGNIHIKKFEETDETMLKQSTDFMNNIKNVLNGTKDKDEFLNELSQNQPEQVVNYVKAFLEDDKLSDKEKQDLIKGMVEVTRPKQVILRQRGDYINTGFMYASAHTEKGPQEITRAIHPVNKMFFKGYNTLSEEAKQDIGNKRLQTFAILLGKVPEKIKQINMKKNYKLSNKEIIDILKQDTSFWYKDVIGELKYHMVSSIPLTMSSDGSITLDNLKNSTVDTDTLSQLQNAMNEFIEKNIGSYKNQLNKLNKYLKENGFMEHKTLGSILYAVSKIKGKDLDFSMFNKEEFKREFGKDFEKRLSDMINDIDAHISEIKLTNSFFFEALTGSEGINIYENSFKNLLSIVDNPQLLQQIIESTKGENALLNNFILSITHVDENGLRHLNDEFKEYLRLANEKVMFSSLQGFSKREIDTGTKKVTIYFLKDANVNASKYYSNVFTKAIDMMGISTVDITKMDMLKKAIGGLFQKNTNPLQILLDTFSKRLDGSIIEAIKDYNEVPLMFLEEIKSNDVEANLGTYKSKEGNAKVFANTTTDSTKITYKINGQEIENKKTFENRKKTLNQVQDKWIQTYFKNVLPLNDLLEPMDSEGTFINPEKEITPNDINTYLANKSMALLNESEKVLASSMANTEIRFRDDSVSESNKAYLDNLSKEFDSLTNQKIDKKEKVKNFNDLLYKLEMDNLTLGIDLPDNILKSIKEAKSLDEIKTIIGSDNYSKMIEAMGDIFREYEMLMNYKKQVNSIGFYSKVSKSVSGRMMWTSKLSFQSNKWSKHFLDFSSGAKEFLEKADNDTIKLYFKSAVRTGLDELGADDIIQDAIKNKKLPKELEPVVNRFRLKGKKDKIDFTKSTNDNLKDHIKILNFVIDKIDPNNLKASQIRYYYPLQQLKGSLNEKVHIGNIRIALQSSKPILELDGSQNVAGTSLALLGKTDDATGINGHQTNAVKDIYEEFADVINTAKDNVNFSNIFSELFGESIKRSDVKKTAQANLYGQSPQNTAKDVVTYYLKKYLFKIEPENGMSLERTRINKLYSVIFGSLTNSSSFINGDLLVSMEQHINLTVSKLNKLFIIQKALENGSKDAGIISKFVNDFLSLYDEEFGLKTNEIKGLVAELTGGTGSSSLVELNKDSIAQLILNNYNPDNPKMRNKISVMISKLNSAISSSISNKDYLETIKMKSESTFEKEKQNLINLANSNPALKIFYYKLLLDKLDNTFKANINSKTSDKLSIKLIFNQTPGIKQIMKAMNDDITSNEYLSLLGKEIASKTNFDEQLNSALKQSPIFKQIYELRDTVESVYKVGEATTLLKLNEKVDDAKLLLNKIFKELGTDKQTRDIIFNDLNVKNLTQEKEAFTYKEIGDLLYKHNISPLRSKVFIDESEIPFITTPSGRRLTFITEKSVGLDKDTNMQYNSFAIINKPLTYFIQGIESDSLSKAVSVAGKKHIIQRYDAVYGEEALEVAKKLNAIYGYMFKDLDFLNHMKDNTKTMLKVITSYRTNHSAEWNDLATEIAKNKVLLNSGSLTGKMDEISKVEEDYKNFFKNNLDVRYKPTNDDTELNVKTRTKQEVILNKIEKIKKIKEDNLKLAEHQTKEDYYEFNQFTNGLKDFSAKIAKKYEEGC